MSNWKQRLYDGYVSSGQARITPESIERILHGRRSYIYSVIQNYLPSDKRSNVIDLGCGHGAYLLCLQELGYTECEGVDTSAEQIDAAKQLGLKRVYVGDIQEFLTQHAEKSADAVLLIDVLEHIPGDELFPLLDAIYRILKPAGRLIIHVPNGHGIFAMGVRYGDMTHEFAFTSTSIQQLMRTVGFSQITAHEEKPVVHSLNSMIRRIIWELGTLPTRLLYLAENGQRDIILSANMIVVAQKSRD